MPMTTTELYSIGSMLNTALSATIAALVFPLWRRYRHRFLIVFGFVALFDIFIALFELTSLRPELSDTEYDAVLRVIYILNIVSALGFGIGLLLLFRYLRAAGIPTPLSSTDATQNV